MPQKIDDLLTLKAEDHDDLIILSAHMQDAIIPVGSLHFDKDHGIFTVLANRFCWERAPVSHGRAHHHHRVHSGLHFFHVKSVKQKGIPQHMPDHLLSLLAIHPVKDHADQLALIFSGHREIRLDIDKVRCHLTDLHEPYPTHVTHDHPYSDPVPR